MQVNEWGTRQGQIGGFWKQHIIKEQQPPATVQPLPFPQVLRVSSTLAQGDPLRSSESHSPGIQGILWNQPLGTALNFK